MSQLSLSKKKRSRRNWRRSKPKTINSFGNQPILVEKTLMSISRKLPFSSSLVKLPNHNRQTWDNWQLFGQKNWENPSSSCKLFFSQQQLAKKFKLHLKPAPHLYSFAGSLSCLKEHELLKKKVIVRNIKLPFFALLVTTLSPCWIIVRLFNKCDKSCFFAAFTKLLHRLLFFCLISSLLMERNRYQKSINQSDQRL